MTFTEVEEARKIYANKRNKLIRIGLIIYLVSPILSFLMGTFFFVFMFSWFLLGYLILVSVFSRKERENYIKAYKAYFVAASCAKIFKNISYNHEAGIQQDIVKRVMDTADLYSSNDYMCATYKNINFIQADINIEKEYTDSDGDSTYVTIFKGRFMVFDFDRNFTSNLQVMSRHFKGARLLHSDSRLNFERIKTESEEFNKKFKVFAENGTDAFYILDPAFMEKIQKLYTDCGHELLLTFIDKKVYIAIYDKKDSLEPPKKIRKPLDEQTELNRVAQDILVITNFVDSLDLDRYFKEKK